MALYAIVFLGSTAIGAPLIGWLAEVAGPRSGLYAGAAAALIAAVLGARGVRRPRGGRAAQAPPVRRDGVASTRRRSSGRLSRRATSGRRRSGGARRASPACPPPASSAPRLPGGGARRRRHRQAPRPRRCTPGRGGLRGPSPGAGRPCCRRRARRRRRAPPRRHRAGRGRRRRRPPARVQRGDRRRARARPGGRVPLLRRAELRSAPVPRRWRRNVALLAGRGRRRGRRDPATSLAGLRRLDRRGRARRSRGLVAGGVAMLRILQAHGRSLERVDRLEALLAEAGVAVPRDEPGLPVGTPAPGLARLPSSGVPVLLLFTDPGCAPCRVARARHRALARRPSALARRRGRGEDLWLAPTRPRRRRARCSSPPTAWSRAR